MNEYNLSNDYEPANNLTLDSRASKNTIFLVDWAGLEKKLADYNQQHKTRYSLLTIPDMGLLEIAQGSVVVATNVGGTNETI